MIVGSHVSIAGGVEKAPERGQEFGCEAIQIFTKSNRQWYAKQIRKEDALKFKDNLKKFKIKDVMAHNSYLINLGSPNKSLLNRSIKAFTGEVKRCELLGVKYLVFHPGSHKGSGEEKCIKTIANSLNQIISKTKKVILLLENTAGQGTNVGYKFEHLRDIMKKVRNKKRVGVCFDTCHAFAAGYDIRTKQAYKKTFNEFSKIVGLSKLKAFHLNDSMKALGSRIDRHLPPPKGKIKASGFRLFIQDKRFKNKMGIVERPDNSGSYTKSIKILKNLRK